MPRLSYQQVLSSHSLSSIARLMTATSSPSWQARDLSKHLIKVGLLALEVRALGARRLLPFSRSVSRQGPNQDTFQLHLVDCSRYLEERWARQLRRQHLVHRSSK